MQADELRAALVYAVLSMAIMLPLSGPGYYLALDMQFGPNSFSEFQFGDFYGFVPSSYGAYYPLRMAFAAVSQAVPVEWLEKLLLFSILLLSGLGMHISLPKELGSSRYFAGLLYTLNPFVFVRFIVGHWSLLLSYAMWPLAIKYFMDFLERPGDRGALEKSALITTAAAISSHGLILLLICYGLLFLARMLRGLPSGLLARRTALLAAAVIALNLFWVVPTLMLYGTIYNPASTTAYLEDFGVSGGGMPVWEAVLTMHGFWRGGITYTKDVQSLWWLPYVLMAGLVLAGMAFLWRKDRPVCLFIAALMASALLLALGPSTPLFGFLKDSPLYVLFRDSQKFVALLPLAYSIAGAWGTASIAALFGRFRSAFVLAALAVVLLHNYGFFGLLGQIGPTQYPADWAEADRIIAADPADASVLLLPSHLYYVYPWANSTQKTLGTPASQFFSKPVVTALSVETPNVYSDINDPVGSYINFLFSNRDKINDTAELLAPLGVRYIILFKSDEDSIHYLYLFKRKGGVHDIDLVYESPYIYLFRDDLVQGQAFVSDDPGRAGFNPLLKEDWSGYASMQYSAPTPAYYSINATGSQYAVLASPYPRLLESGDGPLRQWHGIASVAAAGGQYVRGAVFPLSLGLFMLSWFLALMLLSGSPLARAPPVAFPFPFVYVLSYEGVLGPAALGLLLVTSIAIAAFFRTSSPPRPPRPHPGKRAAASPEKFRRPD